VADENISDPENKEIIKTNDKKNWRKKISCKLV
jgi:hypothetical protein